jgi:predicted NAD-dependent protein-ADP-ribosyltransferase YbiA (DUF1768 family)
MSEKEWLTSEHLFQAMKFPSQVNIMEKIRGLSTPKMALDEGQKYNGFRHVG